MQIPFVPLSQSSSIHLYDTLFSFMLLVMCIASDYISAPNYYWQILLFLGISVYYVLHSEHSNSFSLFKTLCHLCKFHDLLLYLPTFNLSVQLLSQIFFVPDAVLACFFAKVFHVRSTMISMIILCNFNYLCFFFFLQFLNIYIFAW